MAMRLSLAVALVGLVLLSGSAGVSLAAADAQNPPTSGAVPPAPPKMPDMMNMMKTNEQMLAQMKASDATLDALLKEIDGAKGDARIDALVAAVNELARQYKAERAHMGEMHQMMMMGGHETSATAAPPAHVH